MDYVRDLFVVWLISIICIVGSCLFEWCWCKFVIYPIQWFI